MTSGHRSLLQRGQLNFPVVLYLAKAPARLIVRMCARFGMKYVHDSILVQVCPRRERQDIDGRRAAAK